MADCERKLSGIVWAVENGAWSDTLATRLKELEAVRVSLTQQGAQLKTSHYNGPLPPDRAAIYGGIVSELAAALDHELVCGPAAGQLGSLIDTMVLTPDADAWR